MTSSKNNSIDKVSVLQDNVPSQLKMPEEFQLSTYEIILTWNCNLHCTYCYECASGKTTKNLRQTNKELISSEKIMDIVNFIIASHGRNARELRIIFWGGEPLLAFDAIKEFIAKIELAQKSEQINCPVTYSTTSNLTTITLEQMQYLQTKPVSVLVSLDGREETTDRARGKGTFAKVIRNMALLHGLRIPFSIRMTISTADSETLKKDLFFVNGLGYDFWWTFDHNNSDLLTEASIEKTLDVLYQLYTQPQVNASTLPQYLDKKNSSNHTYCINPYKTITVDPEGNLRICSRVDWIIGDIVSGITRFPEIKEIPFYSKTAKTECQICSVYARCKGGCLGAHLDQNTNPALITPNHKLNKSFCREMFLLELLSKNLELTEYYVELKKETRED